MAKTLEVRVLGDATGLRERLLRGALEELVETLQIYDSFLPENVRARATEARMVLEETASRG